MTLEWVLFTFVISLFVCAIVIASLVKCYHCKKLNVVKEIRASDKKIIDLLNEMYKRYEDFLKNK